MDYTPLICDYGSGLSKVGFAGSEAPLAVFPTVLGKLKHNVSDALSSPSNLMSSSGCCGCVAPDALPPILTASCQMAQEGGLRDRLEGMNRQLPFPLADSSTPSSFLWSLVPRPLAISLGSQLGTIGSLLLPLQGPFLYRVRS